MRKDSVFFIGSIEKQIKSLNIPKVNKTFLKNISVYSMIKHLREVYNDRQSSHREGSDGLFFKR